MAVDVGVARRNVGLLTECAAADTVGRGMQARGVTVPATDLVIAATAISHRALLLHTDHHFERLAELGELRQSNPAAG